MNKITNKKNIFIFSALLLTVYYLLPTAFLLAQTNVTLYSVSPASAPVGGSIVITGTNLLQCAPTNLNACNVQFHDINLRRSTTSGTETSNTTVQATVAAGLCPGTTTIKVGELTNFSNAIPFTILDQGPVPAGCRVITSVSPASGTFGTTVTINGRNLHSNVQLYDSSYGKTNVAGAMNTSATRVVFSVPNGLVSGTYSVRVGPDVNDVSNGIPFRLIGDTSAPTISNIRVSNITTSGATVLWDTNELANGQIEICPSLTRCSNNTPLISGLTTAHVVNLSGLTADTRYYIWIKSRDGAGNLATSGALTFKTLIILTPTPTPSPTPPSLPVISNIQVINITRDSATVTWDTNRPADSMVTKCLIRVFCTKILSQDPNLNRTHSFNISGLSANKSQYLQIASGDASERSSAYVPVFKTLPGLLISNININVARTSVTVTWDTNYPANSRLKVCRLPFFCSGVTMSEPSFTMPHSVTATGLTPGTRYYYQVQSVDTAGYTADSQNIYITTLP
ncbi:MAG: IPT/TIG domain-containing protein [Candidatus Yanofskybacteria bacterium]|nr:IPT/TIG domain-containing protein [Candidatus Yanofskybacteria bacterium]